MTPNEDDETRRLIEASAWRVHLTEIGADSTAQFEAWLLSDERNVATWRRVEAPWDFLGEHATQPELLTARAAALGLLRFGHRTQTNWGERIAAAAALLVAAFAGGYFWWVQPADYQTGLGERRTLILADGSRLSLDSDSDVRLAFTGHQRALELVRGQARFEVAHDISRPFLVSAGRATVRATGTDFDVDLPTRGVVVTLLQGRVVVSDGGEHVGLTDGDQLTLAEGHPAVVEKVSPGDVLAWESGQVVFHDVPLEAVVERLNRYDRLPLVIADPELAKLRVSGTFNTGDASAIAEILTGYIGLRAVHSESGAIELRR